MRIRDAFKLRRNLDAVQASFPAGGYSDPSTFPIATPWSSGDLQRIVFEDIFGTDVPTNTRNAAMRLGTIARARNLIVTTLAGAPLIETQDADPVAGQPRWVTHTGDGSSPELRTAWTVDDLIFYGWSCWSRHWADADRTEEIGRSRVAQDDWTIDDDTMAVLVNGIPQDPRDVILIPGLHEGILSFGIDVIADARALYAAVRSRIQNPAPSVELHQTGGEPLLDDDIDALLTSWRTARKDPNGAVGYTSENITANVLESNDSQQLMIEARNAAAVDLARIVGVHAGMVDATAPKSTLNYETQTGRNQEFIDFDIALYMTPITARLSMDDVSEPGRRAAFDLSNFTAPAPAPTTGPGFED